MTREEKIQKIITMTERTESWFVKSLESKPDSYLDNVLAIEDMKVEDQQLEAINS